MMMVGLVIVCIALLFVMFNIRQHEQHIEKRLANYVSDPQAVNSLGTDVKSQLLKNSTSHKLRDLVRFFVPGWGLLSASTKKRIIAGSGLIAIAVGGVIYGSLGHTLLSGLSSIITLLVMLFSFAKLTVAKKINEFEQQLPLAIGTLTRCLLAGISLPAAIEQVHQRSSGLLGCAFKKLSHQLTIGVSLDDALSQVCHELNNTAFSLFSITLRLNQRAGGQLVVILNQLAKDITTRQMLAKKLLAQTAGVRSSAMIITAMVPILLLVFYISAPHILTYFYDDPSGKYVAIYAACSIFLGLIVVRQMTRLEH
jgi:tight adherence protein B